jgi:hypothetical protein
MSSRPLWVTAISWLFMMAGAGGILKDLLPLVTSGPAQGLAALKADGLGDLGPAWGLRLLAVVGGMALLRGRNWARWLLAAWMAVHLGISAFHSWTEALAHCAIFLPILYFLFRRSAAEFFGATGRPAAGA